MSYPLLSDLKKVDKEFTSEGKESQKHPDTKLPVSPACHRALLVSYAVSNSIMEGLNV